MASSQLSNPLPFKNADHFFFNGTLKNSGTMPYEIVPNKNKHTVQIHNNTHIKGNNLNKCRFTCMLGGSASKLEVSSDDPNLS